MSCTLIPKNSQRTILITLKQQKQHTVYRRFGFMSEAFIRTDIRYRNHRSCLQWESCERLGERQGDWLRSRQSWQTHKGGDMDQEDWQHESRREELPVEPRMGQAYTYWRPAPEVSPDEGFRREAETSINSMVFGCIRVINIVFRVNLMKHFTEQNIQPVVSCIQTFTRLSNRFCVNGAWAFRPLESPKF